jgi:hypothetical protein
VCIVGRLNSLNGYETDWVFHRHTGCLKEFLTVTGWWCLMQFLLLKQCHLRQLRLDGRCEGCIVGKFLLALCSEVRLINMTSILWMKIYVFSSCVCCDRPLEFHGAKCRNLAVIWVLVSIVVRRFSIVPICSNRLYIVYKWLVIFDSSYY